MSLISPGRKPDMVQSVLEESITRRPHDPSGPDIHQEQPPSIFVKLFLWFHAQSARAMEVRIVVEKSDNESGCYVITRKAGVIEAHVTRRKNLSPKEEAELKIQVRSQIANLSNAHPLTRRDKFILWLLLLGTVGGIIAMLVWNHILSNAGVAR
jgi:hypothetical protein